MHCTYGYLVLALALTLSVIDTLAAATRLVSYIRSMERGGKFSIRTFWNFVILGKENGHVFGTSHTEYINLAADEPADADLEESLKSNVHHNGRIVATCAETIHDDETAQWVNDVGCHSEDSPETPVSDCTLVSRRGSQHSDDTTVQDQVRFTNNIPLSRRLGKLVFATAERTLVLAGFAQLMHGVVIYTGGCRENYLNGCLAHIISKFRPKLPEI